MRKMLGGLCLLTVFAVTAVAVPLRADQHKAFKRNPTTSRYDVSKETTMEGTIQEVVKKPVRGTMFGAHLTVSTPKGAIDAHIGDFVLRGQHAYSPAAGQSVKLTGVMTTINQKSVFLTRTIETGGRTIQVRSQRGFLIVPGRKGKILQTAAAKGGAQ